MLSLIDMAPVHTAAIVLHSIRYGETSKIVRLATRELGIQSAIAKGAMREKSRFGAKLQTLSQGMAQLYVKSTRELQTLAEFEPTKLRRELARDITKYAVAESLAELMLRVAPAEANTELFDQLETDLDELVAIDTEHLQVSALMILWNAVNALGFTPALKLCARDGRELPSGSVAFSVDDGGFLCKRCSPGRGARTSRLPEEDRVLLEQLVAGVGDRSQKLSAKRNAAHKRLLARFVTCHLTEGTPLKALSYWESLG